jgi:hypothetical protein
MYRDDVTKKLEELRMIRTALLTEICQIQDEECPHEWELLGHGNDHDGWSRFVSVTYYSDFRCAICDKRVSDNVIGNAS